MDINILAVGDVVGASGLDFLRKKLRGLARLKGADFVVVNGENAAGTGLTPADAEDIFAAGADVVTLGNHTWGRDSIKNYLDDCPYIARPINYAPQVPGRGAVKLRASFGEIAVINAIGRVGMDHGPDNPFFAVEKAVKELGCRFTLVDFHAEATSEKIALARYLDGKVSAVWGTHTHVQTSDCRVMPKGTGYITDLGMTGPVESVLGVDPAQSIAHFLGEPPERYKVAAGPCLLEGALFTLDSETGLCRAVEAIRIE